MAITRYKQDEIIDAFRSRIEEGELRPGQRVLTRVEIQDQFEASPVTVQRAMERLVEDGFLRVEGSKGTYVADHPPHLSRYALVLPWAEGARAWSLYWRAVREAAAGMATSSHRSFTEYVGLGLLAERKAYERLQEDVAAGRVAGVIFAMPPWPLAGSPVLSDDQIPWVMIGGADRRLPGGRAICWDSESRLRRTIDYLAARGRRRISLISGLPEWPFEFLALAEAARERGMQADPRWMQGVAFHAPEPTANCMKLLMSLPPEERPDGTIIFDDNIVEDVTAGLAAAGVRAPQDMDVVAHANFPCPPPAALPVHYVGYDLREAMRIAVECIDGARRGEELPDSVMVEGVVERDRGYGVS
jgi:DNA-binding LacI/PurR family transcriptional regulator